MFHNDLRGNANRGRTLHTAKIDSIEQPRQFFGRDLTTRGVRGRLQIGRKLKAAAFKPLVPDRQTVTIPVQIFSRSRPRLRNRNNEPLNGSC